MATLNLDDVAKNGATYERISAGSLGLIWEHETLSFLVLVDAVACETPPEDQMDSEDPDIEAIKTGRKLWFDVRLRVILKAQELGGIHEIVAEEGIGCCCYDQFGEYKNYTEFNASFRSMVSCTIDSARRQILRHQKLRIRG